VSNPLSPAPIPLATAGEKAQGREVGRPRPRDARRRTVDALISGWPTTVDLDL